MSYTTPTNPPTLPNGQVGGLEEAGSSALPQPNTPTSCEIEAAKAIGVAFANVFLAAIRAYVRDGHGA